MLNIIHNVCKNYIPIQTAHTCSLSPLYVNFESTNVTMNRGNGQSKEGDGCNAYFSIFLIKISKCNLVILYFYTRHFGPRERKNWNFQLKKITV